MSWQRVVSHEELNQKKRTLFKEGSQQIVVLQFGDELFALDNRCPHQGYPLYEGSVDSDRALTCHWHNWKFDLKSGRCVSGGDSVRTYPTKKEGGFVWVDLSAPSKEEIQRQILEGLKIAFDDRKYGRLSREITRLYYNDIDPKMAVGSAIEWSYERLKEGMGAAYCAAADWLLLYSEQKHCFENQLICLMEAVDGIAYEAFRKKADSSVILSCPKSNAPKDLPSVILRPERPKDLSSSLLTAIENENEKLTIGLLSSALDSGFLFRNLEEILIEASLAHYYERGKALIGLQKIASLIEHLGDGVTRPLLFAWVRSLCHLTREDLNPTFSHPDEKKGHPEAKGESPQPKDLFHQILQRVVKNILYFNLEFQFSSEKPVSQNIDLFDVSEPLVFAHAVSVTCQKYPKFSTKVIEQLSYFCRKYDSFCDNGLNASEWNISDEQSFWNESLEKVLDHGIAQPPSVASRLSAFVAVRGLTEQLLPRLKRDLLSSLNRILNTPLKEKHTRRKARQNIELVSRDFKIKN